MADDTASEKFRSFTIRVPMSRYVQMSSLAQNEGLHLNQKVNQILALGMDEHIKLDTIVGRLIKRSLTDEVSAHD